MRTALYGLVICVGLLMQQNLQGTLLMAEDPSPKDLESSWPDQVTITVGDIRTRIDGPKLWTLSGIDYQDVMMATEDSAYGSVFTIRNVGHLGTAHFLDVPGKPGEVEKEDVTALRLFIDDKPIEQWQTQMVLSGHTFRMERESKIRSVNLRTSVSIHEGVLIETAHLQSTGKLDLITAYPWMYAWTPHATHYLFGNEKGVQRQGTFLPTGETVAEVVKDVTWFAAFNAKTGKGNVCCSMQHPPQVETSLLLVNAPTAYRKIAAYTLVDNVLDEKFSGTYQAAIGFFSATEKDWKEQAIQRVAEVQAIAKRP